MDEDAPEEFSPILSPGRGGVLDMGVGAIDDARLYTRNEVKEGAE